MAGISSNARFNTTINLKVIVLNFNHEEEFLNFS